MHGYAERIYGCRQQSPVQDNHTNQDVGIKILEMKYFSVILEIGTDEDPENVVKEVLEADPRIKDVIIDSVVEIEDYEKA